MPLIGAVTGGLDFSNYFVPLSSKVTATSLADAKKQGAVLAWGNFLTLAINFLIIAWVLFLCIKGINRLKAPEAPAAHAAIQGSAAAHGNPRPAQGALRHGSAAKADLNGGQGDSEYGEKASRGRRQSQGALQLFY